MPEFTAQEKSRIKYFLSYPDWQALSNAITLGFPSGSQPLFLVDQAFTRITEEGRDSVRRVLCQCEAVESQIIESRSRLKATQMGNLKLNQEEMDALLEHLRFWVARLATTLGSTTNPYGQFEYENISGNGINMPVEH